MNTESNIRGIDRDVTIIPVTLRNPFKLSCISVLGQVQRFSHPEYRATIKELEALHENVRKLVTSSDLQEIAREDISVLIGKNWRVLDISRENSQFLGVDNKIPEFKYGYEPEISAAIDIFVPNDGVFVDIGSNWGLFSIFLAVRGGFEGQIFAYEPGYRAFEDMRKLVDELVLCEKIELNKIGISDRSGSARLSVGLQSGLASIVNDNGNIYETIEVSSLDELTIANCNLIKIDVEGSEAAVLRGGIQYISRCSPLIVFENWFDAQKYENSVAPFHILSQLDYEFYAPFWTTAERQNFSTRPVGKKCRQHLAFCQFDILDRANFDQRINVLAVPRVKKGLLAEASEKAFADRDADADPTASDFSDDPQQFDGPTDSQDPLQSALALAEERRLNGDRIQAALEETQSLALESRTQRRPTPGGVGGNTRPRVGTPAER